MDGIIKFFIDLIMKPGSSLTLVPVINFAILALLILMICLTYSKIATIHIIVMSTLAIGLLLSVNWVYYEIQKMPPSALETLASDTTQAKEIKQE